MTAVRSGSGAGRQPALGAWTERPRAHRAMIAALLLLATALGAQEPPRVIVDTDMLTDCDDAGALAVLHALADLGEVAILGIVLNGIDAHGKHGAVVSAIDTYYHRGDLPIG